MYVCMYVYMYIVCMYVCVRVCVCVCVGGGELCHFFFRPLTLDEHIVIL